MNRSKASRTRATKRRNILGDWLDTASEELLKQLDLESESIRGTIHILKALLGSSLDKSEPLFKVKQKRCAGTTEVFYQGLKSVCLKNKLEDDSMSAIASLVSGERMHIYDSQCFAQFCTFKERNDSYIARLRQQIHGCEDFGIIVNLGNWHWVSVWYLSATCTVEYYDGLKLEPSAKLRKQIKEFIHIAKNVPEEDIKWSFPRVIQQTDSKNCGIIALAHLAVKTRDWKINVDSSDIESIDYAASRAAILISIAECDAKTFIEWVRHTFCKETGAVNSDGIDEDQESETSIEYEEFQDSKAIKEDAESPDSSMEDRESDSRMDNENAEDEKSDSSMFHENDDPESSMSVEDDSQFDEPALGMEFPSKEEFVSFCTKYSKSKGFSLNVGGGKNSGKLEFAESISVKCECWRKPADTTTKRSKRPSKGTNCKMIIRAFLQTRGKVRYKITTVNLDHNHDLKGENNESHFAPLRQWNELVRSRVIQLGQLRVSTEFINRIVSDEFNLTLRNKDINNCLSMNRPPSSGDARHALGFLEAKKEEGWIVHSRVNSAGQLMDLFWMDDHQVLLYNRFSDVLIHDCTYRSNKYNMALGLMTVVDQNSCSRVVGQHLMINEDSESFEWLFEKLPKAPNVIFTDQDLAVISAVAECFPNAKHFFCVWHLSQNLLKNLRTKFSSLEDWGKFMERFHAARTSDTQEDFEKAMETLSGDYPPCAKYLGEICQSSGHWAEYALKQSFTCGIKTTQRAESTNFVVKRFLTRKARLCDVIREISNVIRRQYGEEDSRSAVVKCSPAFKHVIELCSKYLSRKIVDMIQVQMQLSIPYEFEIHSSDDGNIQATVHRGSRSRSLRIETNGATTCSCGIPTSVGIPCRHFWRIFASPSKKIPFNIKRCLNNRWFKKGLQDYQVLYVDGSTASDEVLPHPTDVFDDGNNYDETYHDNFIQDLAILRLRADVSSLSKKLLYDPEYEDKMIEARDFLRNLLNEKESADFSTKDDERNIRGGKRKGRPRSTSKPAHKLARIHLKGRTNKKQKSS